MCERLFQFRVSRTAETPKKSLVSFCLLFHLRVDYLYLVNGSALTWESRAGFFLQCFSLSTEECETRVSPVDKNVIPTHHKLPRQPWHCNLSAYSLLCELPISEKYLVPKRAWITIKIVLNKKKISHEL